MVMIIQFSSNVKGSPGEKEAKGVEFPKLPIANTIRDQVYQLLKEEICNGKYEPGYWLQEKEVAARLRVSRSPVREALRQLTRDGLVRDIPNKGVFVREFSIQDIEDVFDLRIMMESFALLHTSPKLEVPAKERLLEMLRQIEQAHTQGDRKAYITADIQFHHYLIELCGNTFLVKAYGDVYSMIKQFCIYSLIDLQRFDDSMVEHREIVHGIVTGQMEEAERCNRVHLELTKQKLAEVLGARKPSPAVG